MINRLIKKPNGIQSLTKVILQGKQLFRWRFLHTWKETYMAAISLQPRNKNTVVFVVLFSSWKLLSGRMTIRCQFLIGRELSSCEHSFSFQVYLLAHTVCLYANLPTIFWTKILRRLQIKFNPRNTNSWFKHRFCQLKSKKVSAI